MIKNGGKAMENIKIDENRLVPDIRPENIETITETYAPSGGGVNKQQLIK